MGKSENSMRSREVLMCSERYAEETPLEFLNTQLPPTRSDPSKQSNSKPRWCSAFAAAMPDDPAPMTQTRGSSPIATASHEGDGGVKFEAPAGWRHGSRQR